MIGAPIWFILWQLANDGDRSGIIAASFNTKGIARMMAAPGGQAAGGGDLNGSAATHYLGQAGTAGQRISVPRASAGNYTGVV
jgi:hypothetical protein